MALALGPSDVLGDGLIYLSGDPSQYPGAWEQLCAPPFNIVRVVRVLRDPAPPPSSMMTTLHLPVEDHVLAPLSQYFQTACDFIESGVLLKQPTLVHCAAGVSRSVSIVLAYLVQKRSFSLAGALEKVRLTRPFVNPNQGFLQQLVEWEVSQRGTAPSLDADEEFLTTMGRHFGKTLSSNELRSIYHSPECKKNPTRFTSLVAERIEEDDYTTYLHLRFPVRSQQECRDVFLFVKRDVERAIEVLSGTDTYSDK